MLSANSEANMSVECLMEDEDFHSQMGREDWRAAGVEKYKKNNVQYTSVCSI